MRTGDKKKQRYAGRFVDFMGPLKTRWSCAVRAGPCVFFHYPRDSSSNCTYYIESWMWTKFPSASPPSNVHLLHLRTLRVRCIFTLCLQTRTQTLQGASFFRVALKFCSLVFWTRNCVRRGWTKRRYNFLWLYAADASLAYIWCSSSTVPSQVPANHFLS